MNITNSRRREGKLQWKVGLTDSIITHINLMERCSYFWRNMGFTTCLPIFFYSTSFEHMCITGPNYYFSFGHHPSFFLIADLTSSTKGRSHPGRECFIGVAHNRLVCCVKMLGCSLVRQQCCCYCILQRPKKGSRRWWGKHKPKSECELKFVA